MITKNAFTTLRKQFSLAFVLITTGFCIASPPNTTAVDFSILIYNFQKNRVLYCKDNLKKFKKNLLLFHLLKPALLYSALFKEKLNIEKIKLFCARKRPHDDFNEHCWKTTGHGNINLQEALEKCCHSWFQQLCYRMRKKKALYHHLIDINLNTTPFDLRYELYDFLNAEFRIRPIDIFLFYQVFFNGGYLFNTSDLKRLESFKLLKVFKYPLDLNKILTKGMSHCTEIGPARAFNKYIHAKSHAQIGSFKEGGDKFGICIIFLKPLSIMVIKKNDNGKMAAEIAGRFLHNSGFR
ncbi:hypothetical protein ACFL35_08160 [Candidatus Riflebacteria bacterium]